MFTSAQQVVHLLQVAAQMQLEARLREMLSEVVVGAIGPTTQEALRQHDLPVDFVPSRPKLGPFVQEAATHLEELRRRKRRIRSLLSGPATDVLDVSAPWFNGPFMKACRGEPNDVTPIWLMRQAGRYLAEYRAIREKVGLPGTVQAARPVRRDHGNHRATAGSGRRRLSSPTCCPFWSRWGWTWNMPPGEGPVIHNPLRESGDVDRLLELDQVDSLDFVFATVAKTRQALPPAIPLIGFAGAPFTLASYAIEGGASRNYLHTKTLMYRDEGAWRELMQRLARASDPLSECPDPGRCPMCAAFRFVGGLPLDDRLPSFCASLHGRCDPKRVSPGVPVISFATGNPALLPLLAEAGPAVVGVDWRIDLDDAWKRIGWNRSIQGNLDPAVLLADAAEVTRQARQILQQAAGRPGHIFNLGHGVLPQTPVDNVLRLIEEVKKGDGSHS